MATPVSTSNNNNEDVNKIPITPVDTVDLSEDFRYAAYASRISQLFRAATTNPLMRYSAYTSDIGEGFRSATHPLFVKACYGISWLYVIGDSINETWKRYEETRDGMEAARTGTLRITFNALASMFFPMMTVHTVCHQTSKLLQKTQQSAAVKKWVPVAAGLAIVPALPFMFDHPVETACEYIWDKAWPSKYAHHPSSTDTVSHLGVQVNFDDNDKQEQYKKAAL